MADSEVQENNTVVKAANIVEVAEEVVKYSKALIGGGLRITAIKISSNSSYSFSQSISPDVETTKKIIDILKEDYEEKKKFIENL